MTDERGWQTTDGTDLVAAFELGATVVVADTSDGGPRRAEPSLVARTSPDGWNPEVQYVWLEGGGFILAGPGATVTWREA